METGKRVYTIPEAHGANIEVTALCLDSSGYRLASGAFDGKFNWQIIDLYFNSYNKIVWNWWFLMYLWI